MTERKHELKDPRWGTALGVKVITRATATELAGKTDEGVVKVRLQAAHAGNPEANQELIGFIAEQLSVAADKIEIVAGLEQSSKLLSIEGITIADVEAKLFPQT